VALVPSATPKQEKAADFQENRKSAAYNAPMKPLGYIARLLSETGGFKPHFHPESWRALLRRKLVKRLRSIVRRAKLTGRCAG